MGIATFFIIFLSIFLMGALVFVLFLFSKDRVPQDATILQHYMTQYTKGHVEGLITKTIIGKERTAIFFQPKDNNYLKYFIKKVKFKKEVIMLIARNDLMEHLPRGVWSSHRNFLKVYPCKAERIPEGLKRTIEGQRIMQFIEGKNKEKLQVDVLREIMKRKDKIMKENAGNEISPQFMENKTKQYEAGMEAVIKNLGKEKSSSTSTTLKTGGS